MQEEYWPIGLIKYLARFPHEYSTWLGWGHTIPNGPDYEPLAPDTGMGGVVLVQTGGDMGSMEAKDGRKVNFYMVIPAYREEIEYKLEYGMEALDKRFSEGNLPMVLDIHRPNLCADFKE
ncbi:MAG: suppressor of fused domain protein [Enterocloster sp.]